MSSLIENIVACPDCDLLQHMPALPPGGKARCPRCGCTIASSKPDSLDRTLALTVAAAVVLVIANVEPLMGISAVGRQASTTILGGVLEMWMQGHEITAILVAFCIIVAPAVHITFMLSVLLAVRQPPAPSWAGTLMQVLAFNQPWAMVEVMMLGILVALVKIADLATVSPGVGMFAAGALIALIAAMTVSFDPHEAWTRIRWADEEMMQSTAVPDSLYPGRTGP
jgi:paraquat-inducible protein A